MSFRIAFVANEENEAARAAAGRFVAAAAARDLETIRVDGGPVPDGTDYLVGIGGDGTMLQAAGLAIPAGIPAFGVNVGHVGYLADIEPDDIGVALDRLGTGDFHLSARMTIDAVRDGTTVATGINDVVLEKAASQRIVYVRVDVDGERFTTYRADGLVVATATGSTAYSFSAGGPIVSPELEVIVMTPIAPHSLFDRSVVFAERALLEFTIERDRPAQLNVDGVDCGIVDPGETVAVRRSTTPLRFVDFGIHRFPQTMRKGFEIDRDR